jgi:hypothetical protein
MLRTSTEVRQVSGWAGGGPAGQGEWMVLSPKAFTEANFITSNNWTTVQDLFNAIEEGTAYVNVHTNDGVGSTNTGPGDFPGGEIRGPVH